MLCGVRLGGWDVFKHASSGSCSPAVPDMSSSYSIFNKSADKMCRCMIDERFPSCIKLLFATKKCFTFGRALPPNKLKIMFEFIELLIAYAAVAKSGLSDRRWIGTPVVLSAKNYFAVMKRRTSQQREHWSPRLRFQSLFSARTKDEMRVLWMQLKAKRGKTRRWSFIIVSPGPGERREN